MIKKGIYFLLIILTISVFWYRELIYYGYIQAKGQLEIIWEARPVQEFLDNQNTPDSIRHKLILVNKVKAYAVDSLGISPSNNYTSMYDQKGKPLMWVVTGSKPFKLEPKLWQFPIVGGFPYKGFFDPEMAVLEKNRLISEGLDASIRNAGGWSTLGWLDDPILSDMLRRDEGQLADLIIHELTHFTLFVKDSVEFNENLASFVGEQGAIKFLTDEYGAESQELKEYLGSKKDYDKFVKHFIVGANRLDSLYQNFDVNTPEPRKLALKQAMINNIVETVDTINFMRPDRFHNRLNSKKINNTYFLSYLRYQSKQDLFREEFRSTFNSNVKAYIEYYKSKYPVD
jgi:predicted aminopeptidase